MAREIRQRTALIPIGTTPAAPVTVDMTMPPRIVDALEIIVPPGPSGLVGFYIANSGVQIIPLDLGEYIITAAEKIVWPLEGFITSGSWQLVGYNTGTQAHSVVVRFLCSLVTDPIHPGPVLISEADLTSTPAAETADFTSLGAP